MEGEDVYDLPRHRRVVLTEHYQPTELERMSEATAENPIATELPPESPDDAAGQRRLVIEAIENVLVAVRAAPLEVPVTFVQAPLIVKPADGSPPSPIGVAFVIQYGEQRDFAFRMKSERPPQLSGLVGVNGAPLVPGC